MKKIVCIALVLVFCLATVAFAAVPSKQTNNVEATVPFEGATITNTVPAGKEAAAQQLEAVISTDIAQLFTEVQAAATVDQKNTAINNYFGARVSDMIVGNGELSIVDMVPSFAVNFPQAIGDETFETEMAFDTLFVPGTQVIIAVGMLDSNGQLVWQYFVGNVTANGAVSVVMPLKLMNEVAQNGSMVATITYDSNIVK